MPADTLSAYAADVCRRLLCRRYAAALIKMPQHATPLPMLIRCLMPGYVAWRSAMMRGHTPCRRHFKIRHAAALRYAMIRASAIAMRRVMLDTLFDYAAQIRCYFFRQLLMMPG